MDGEGEVNHQNELAIVEACETWLRTRPRGSNNEHCGISVDLYQFCYDQEKYQNNVQEKYQTNGYIFHANAKEDLTFGGEIEQINALYASNKRDAMFIVHEPSEQQDLEDLMKRSLRLKHLGIGKTYVVGYNTQISKVVSAFGVPTSTFTQWLKDHAPTSNAIPVTIPPQVQQLIRTGYQAIETIWARGCTSDDLAKADSYHMIDNWVKIDPLRIRDRNPGEDDQMPIRRAFSQMILDHIHNVWEDSELLDLIRLLNNEAARAANILDAPVLLSPSRRELMYHTYDKMDFVQQQLDWLQVNAYPGDEWKNNASNMDPALKKIIDYQVQYDKHGDGFSLNFKGALHFGSVVTAHYKKHFNDTATNPLNVDMKTRVDLVLKKVLPRMLSKIFNSEYEYQEGAP